jgi:hypothetical protein
MLRAEHRVGESWRDYRHRSAALREMAMLAAGSLVLAAVAVVVIAWAERQLAAFGWAFTSSSVGNVYTDVMLGVAGMGGVFIGLYYAAVSAVATQAYADVPNEIRFLLSGDIAGRAYMGLLTFVTCFALLHLALHVAVPGYTSGIAVIGALLLSAISVVVFVQLGNRAFHLLDPTAFSHDLLRELDHWVDRARGTRRRSTWPEFQQHAQVQAQSAITILDAIIERSTANVSGLDSVPKLCTQLLGALIRYQSRKPEIPSDSRWFPPVNVQRRWFLSDDIVTSTAAQTGTALQPDSRTDRSWLEDRIDRTVRKMLSVLAAQGRFDPLLICLTTLARAMQRRARSGDVPGCVSAWTDIAQALIPHIVAHGRQISEDALPLAACDALASIPVSIAIGFREYMEAYPVPLIRRDVGELSARKPFPFTRHPFHLAERVHWIAFRTEYEVLAEGSTASPAWYHDELVRQVEVQQLERCIDVLIDITPSHYATIQAALPTTENATFEAAFLERRLEFLTKARFCLERAVARFQELSAQRNITGLPWARIDKDLINRKLVEREGDLVDRMAAVSLALIELTESESVPDYGGRFLAKVAEATFDAAAKGNAQRFAKLFGALALGSLRIAEKLRAKIGPNVERDPKLIAAVAATAEFLDIAGYALVFSEIHGQPAIWTTAKGVLDYVFKKEPAKSAQYLTAVLGLSEYGRAGIPHMASFRQQRSMELSRQMEPLLSERHGPFAYGRRVNHPNAIVRAVGATMGLSAEGLDVFSFAYVHKELGAPLRDIGYKARNIAERIARESEDASDDDVDDEVDDDYDDSAGDGP